MSNDTTTILNPGVAGDAMDESLGVGGNTKRPRVVIGGDDPSEGLAKVRATTPSSNDEGLVVRPLGDLSTETSFNKRFGVATLGTPQAVSSTGPTTLYTPTSGKSLRLKWFAMATPETNTTPVIATVTIGSTDIYIWPLGAPGAFSHSSVREGAVDEVLTITLDTNGQPVYCNMDIEEF